MEPAVDTRIIKYEDGTPERTLQLALEELHKAATSSLSCFTCSGSLPVPAGVKLGFHESDRARDLRSLHYLHLTGRSGVDIEQLIATCTEASFGQGTAQVKDPSYRKALELRPDQFMLNFALAEHNILPQIKRLSCPDDAGLTASLYKLNVHRAGHFFKAHVDTPRESLVGSLVVCLPHAHEGGALVVRHRDQQVKYKWAGQQGATVQWAFFYSDCEHEVEEVTDGTRITVTYNLYTHKDAAASEAIKYDMMPLGEALKRHLQSESFLPSGGDLGFALEHLYPHTAKGWSSLMLKGADAAVLTVAQQLGLEAKLEPVWSNDDQQWVTDYEEDSEGYLGRNAAKISKTWADPVPQGCWENSPVAPWHVVGGSFKMLISKQDYEPDGELVEDPYTHLRFAADAGPQGYYASRRSSKFSDSDDDEEGSKSLRRAGQVHWVSGDFKSQVAMAFMRYGNEAWIDAAYSAAALIVTVPDWQSRKAQA